MGVSHLIRRALRREACAVHREVANGVVETPTTGDDWYWECREFAEAMQDDSVRQRQWLDWRWEKEQERLQAEYEKMMKLMEQSLNR